MTSKLEISNNGKRVVGSRIPKAFTPVAEGVLVQLIPQTESEGGIKLVDHYGGATQRDTGYQSPMGWVIAIGPEVKQIKEGDKVLLGNQPLCVIVYPGITQNELVLTTESYIAGIVDKVDGKYAI